MSEWFGAAIMSKNRQRELEAERRLVAEKNNARLAEAETLLRKARWHIHLPNPDLIAKIDTFLNGGDS